MPSTLVGAPVFNPDLISHIRCAWPCPEYIRVTPVYDSNISTQCDLYKFSFCKLQGVGLWVTHWSLMALETVMSSALHWYRSGALHAQRAHLQQTIARATSPDLCAARLYHTEKVKGADTASSRNFGAGEADLDSPTPSSYLSTTYPLLEYDLESKMILRVRKRA